MQTCSISCLQILSNLQRVHMHIATAIHHESSTELIGKTSLRKIRAACDFHFIYLFSQLFVFLCDVNLLDIILSGFCVFLSLSSNRVHWSFWEVIIQWELRQCKHWKKFVIWIVEEWLDYFVSDIEIRLTECLVKSSKTRCIDE